MIMTRTELAKLLNVSEKYLCPSNFIHAQGGAKLKGYNLSQMNGKGKNATFELSLIQDEFADEVWKNLPIA